MNSRFALAFTVALVAFGSEAVCRAECAAATARAGADVPARWREALDTLRRSTAEPGHPWSCAGGTLTLALSEGGMVLRVEREDEPVISRRIDAPEDLVPLGQALLADPLVQPVPHDEATTPVVERPVPPLAALTVSPSDVVKPAPARSEPRLFLGVAVDGRGVGSSGIGWMGPTASAAVPMGHWLPSISLRYQGSLADGPPLEEGSFGIGLQYRIPIRSFELRAGAILRGAAVMRDLPRPQGEQSQLQGRVGGVASLVIPVFSWARVVVGIDGDVVAVTRETAGPTAASGTSLRPFPTWTLGGTAGVEVPL